MTAVPAGRGERRARQTVLLLRYEPPFAWSPLLAFLGARAIPGVEAVMDGAYLRSVRAGEHRGWLCVQHVPERSALRVQLSAGLAPVRAQLARRVRALFDLDARPAEIAAHLRRDRGLRASVLREPGLRVPGALDGFELALRAVLGQQVSVRAATTFAGRLAAALGEPLVSPHAPLARLAPSCERIAGARPAQLTAIGLTGARARTLRALAAACRDGGLQLEPGADPDATCAALQALPGIGPWTAQYVAMRALRAPDAFPDGDLGLRRALGNLPARELRARAEAWRPWRAYAALHLWHGLGSGG